jgi:hypothetical protein
MKLSEIAQVMGGHPFRAAILDEGYGSYVVQMRNVDSALGIQWDQCIQTNIRAKKNTRWLEVGDILLLARGNHIFPTYVSQTPETALVAPEFHIIRVTAPDLWKPEALAAYLCRGPFQDWLEKNIKGIGNQRHINVSTLKEAPIPKVGQDVQDELINLKHQLEVQEHLVRDLRKQVIGYSHTRLEAVNWKISSEDSNDDAE